MSSGWTRLRKRADFQRVFLRGRSLAGRLLVLRWAPGSDGTVRIGLAAGRHLGGAVIRNRVRRRWREVIRRGPGLSGAWDLVLVARQPCVDASWSELAGAWADAVRRAGIGVLREG